MQKQVQKKEAQFVASYTDVRKELDAEIMKARMIVAFKQPRDLAKIEHSLSIVLSGKKTIEEAMYSVPRKGGSITGPSIKLVKDIAGLYGHLAYGVRKISSDKKGVDGLAFCLDLQKNISEDKEFRVEYPSWVLNMKNPEEDKYKSYMSAGAKRERACIERIIPSFIMNKAIEIVEKKSREIASADLKDKDPKQLLNQILESFKKIDSRIEMVHLLKRIDINTEDEITAEKLVLLRKVYVSLSERVCLVQDQFIALRERNIEASFEEVKKDNSEIVEKLGVNQNDPTKI